MSEKWLIGIDLGGTTCKIAFTDLSGTILYQWEIATNLAMNGSIIIESISQFIKEKFTELGKTKADFLGVGMGAPGPINATKEIILEAVNLGWTNYPLKKMIEESLAIPAVIENDANMAAYGELWQGAGLGTKDMIAITLGTGVGGGIIANGQIINGVNGAGGEIGHVTIVLENGIPCNCGKKGCLETLVSATGIVRMGNYFAKQNPRSRLNDLEEITAKAIYQLASEGDLAAQDVAERVGYYLGAGLSHLGNTLNPEKIIIGGGVSQAGDALLLPTQKYFKKFTFPAVKNSTKIVLAELGNLAGVLGGAGLVLKHSQIN